MALAPQFFGHRYGAPSALHTLEVYLDYVCPFSAKIYKKLREEVLPYVDKTYPGNLSFIFRQQVQAWHPNSTLVHEAAIAVERLDQSKFFEYSDALFLNQKDFFDESTYQKSRAQIYCELGEIAHKIGVSSDAFLELVKIPPVQPNGARNTGNAVDNDLKLHIKLGRQNGIHVSPTVVFDGIIDDSVSSGWQLDEWKNWLKLKMNAQM